MGASILSIRHRDISHTCKKTHETVAFKLAKLRVHEICPSWSYGVAVITSALHAEGRRFEPGLGLEDSLDLVAGFLVIAVPSPRRWAADPTGEMTYLEWSVWLQSQALDSGLASYS
uniref:Protein kinase domain-containing protein n=1 Tax=Syphacia muris TaxID=451379 RepID=A0A0N5B0T2_9BILA